MWLREEGMEVRARRGRSDWLGGQCVIKKLEERVMLTH